MPLTHRLARLGWPLRRLLRSTGLDVVAYGPTSPDWQLAEAIRRRGIGIALDVGANRGQYASHLRQRGFAGIIHSFEPLSAPFAELARLAAGDARHQVHQLAFSDVAGETEIFVGANDQTSSLRRPLDRENEADGIARAHAVAGCEIIRTERLDDFLPAHGIDPAACFLKLDVQGHEMSVLQGAGALLGRFPLLQMELSMRPIYAGETGFGEFVDFVQRQGFRVRALRPNYFDPDDETLAQVDLIAEGPA
jgi:FkbM family methyltransferase